MMLTFDHFAKAGKVAFDPIRMNTIMAVGFAVIDALRFKCPFRFSSSFQGPLWDLCNAAISSLGST